MAVIAQFTDYLVRTPDFFVQSIQDGLTARDLPGITGDRIQRIEVTSEHPFVQLVGQVLVAGAPQTAGLIPAISVTEGDETEEATTIGQGQRTVSVMTDGKLTALKAYGSVKNRNRDGVISAAQILAIETALTTKPDGLLMEVSEFYERESVNVSLWTHSVQERQVLGAVLRSIVYDMRKSMIAKKLHDISIRTAKGLVNFNFGKLLYGEEIEITYMNGFRIFTVSDDSATAITDVDVEGVYRSGADQVEIWDVL